MEYLGIDFSCALGSLRNGNFPDKDCLLPLISKLLGYAIVAASTTVKLPQILKILKHRSVRGLNMLSFELEVVGYTIALAYCLHKGLPFSAYGELLFLLIQAFVLVAIIYYYSQPASQHAIFMFARIPQIWRNFSGTISELIWMGTGEDSTAKPSKPSSSTSSTQIPLAPSYPDWSSSMQAYYAPGVPPPPFFASTVASPTPHPYLWGSQHPLIPPYGTPIPYSAIYPPGSVYAHPSMATAPSTTQHGTESVGKGPDGKYQVSTKNPKGMSANTSSKTGDNGKAGSGSGNDAISQSAESGLEGSSDASDENTNQQESATNKKRSFNQMLVDGANTQNNSVGATAVPGKPVVSTMSATILNIGMELWNASSAPAAVTPSTITGREVTLGDQWTQDERELKRQKRKQSNRESARSSRLRKQAECEELQKRVESLGNENQTLREELQRVSEECEKLTSENNSIKEELKRLCGPEAVANVE